MRYISVCSGIEAASVAWDPLGWKPVAFSEIEAFPCAVLKHRFPDTPNYGSITDYEKWPLEPGSIDLLVGGTPCQSYSILGDRAGLDDPRGALALAFAGLAGRIRPRWIVWENVVGVLSSGRGRDFDAFKRSLAVFGYSCCWRILDSANFGSSQRRRRVFLVGHLGDWKRPATVLLEPGTMRGDDVTRQRPWKEDAEGLEEDAGNDSGPVAFQPGNIRRKAGAIPSMKIFPTLSCDSGDQNPHVCVNGEARKLTPVEWERLQGFPDNFSRIPWKGAPEEDCPDHLRHNAIGNSMCVPVMRWIGRRIDIVDKL